MPIARDGDTLMVSPYCAGIYQLAKIHTARNAKPEMIAELHKILATCEDSEHSKVRAPAPAVDPTLPPLLIRGWNFATAMARHAASGFKRRSKSEIKKRLDICQACPNLVDHHCTLCGCGCSADAALMNKLALVSEKCPIGKWE